MINPLHHETEAQNTDRHIITILSTKNHNTKTHLPVQSLASPTAGQGVASLTATQSHTFVEIDHEIRFTVILLLWVIHEGLLSDTNENMYMEYWLTA